MIKDSIKIPKGSIDIYINGELINHIENSIQPDASIILAALMSGDSSRIVDTITLKYLGATVKSNTTAYLYSFPDTFVRFEAVFSLTDFVGYFDELNLESSSAGIFSNKILTNPIYKDSGSIIGIVWKIEF